jgi:hypothetical protein
MRTRSDFPGKNSSSERIKEPIFVTENDYSQQRTDRGWIGLGEIIAAGAQSIFNQPDQLLKCFGAEPIRPAEIAAWRVRAALHKEAAVVVQGKPDQW